MTTLASYLLSLTLRLLRLLSRRPATEPRPEPVRVVVGDVRQNCWPHEVIRC